MFSVIGWSGATGGRADVKRATARMKNGNGLYKPAARTVNLRLRG